MSVSQFLYIGPYVRCRKEIVDQTEDVRGCPKCRQEDETETEKFCPECGGKISSFKKKFKGPKIDNYDIEEIGNKAMRPVPDNTGEFDDKFDIYVPDRIKGVKRKLEQDGDCSQWQALATDFTVAEEIRDFRDQYAKQLEWIKTSYAEYCVEWGLIVSYY